jgi:tRNA threonylcarbamoyladenosine biosynthesis protein TsaB
MSAGLVLAIDTSFGPVSAALAGLDGRAIAAVEADNPPGSQAETLPPLVADLFAQAKARVSDLRIVAVTVGPGAFTGVRVGLAFAKGLRIGTGASLLGFTTLECLAAQVVQASAHAASVVAAIDARRGAVYLQIFDRALAPLGEAVMTPVEDGIATVKRLARPPFVLAGSGSSLLAASLGSAQIVDVPRIDAKLLASRAIHADPGRHPPVPAYLRDPDARLPS